MTDIATVEVLGWYDVLVWRAVSSFRVDRFNRIAGRAPCRDCVDGKVSIERLAAVWRRVWMFPVEDRTVTWTYGEGWQACIDHLREVGSKVAVECSDMAPPQGKRIPGVPPWQAGRRLS